MTKMTDLFPHRSDRQKTVLEIMMMGDKVETVLFVKNENVVFDLKPC